MVCVPLLNIVAVSAVTFTVSVGVVLYKKKKQRDEYKIIEKENPYGSI